MARASEDITETEEGAVEFWAVGLSGRDRVFVQEYCVHYSAARAYRAAHPDATEQSVSNNAYKSRARLSKPISLYAAAVTKNIREELENQLLQIYRVRATYRAADLYTDEGYLKPPDELGELAYVVDTVTPYILSEGRGAKRTKRLVYEAKELANRQANLDKLDRIIGLINPEDRLGEGGGGGYVLLPQGMTLDAWENKYGTNKNTGKNEDQVPASKRQNTGGKPRVQTGDNF